MSRYNKHIQVLINKFLHGKATEDEVNQLNSWYHSFDDSEVEFPDIPFKDFVAQKQSMLSNIKRDTVGVKSLRSNYLNIAWKVAASVAIIIGIGFGLYFTKNITQTQISQEFAIVTISTELGLTKKLTLTDGSIVKLNVGSSVYYTDRFGQDSREIKLIGEAFFQVAKDDNKPFKVITGDITTIALGTSFNINAYPEKGNIDISLATGKVKVEASDNSKKVIDSFYLEPGEKASYSLSTKDIRKQIFDPDEILAWKDGIIYFKNADEAAIIEKLERWYDVDIEVVKKTSKSIDLTTKFEKASLENVLESLGFTLGFEFSINDKKVDINYSK